jgi:hypothetical protein
VGEWVKQGLVLAPPLHLRFSCSHAALPTIDPAQRWLYFSTRDEEGRSWIARAEISLSDGGVTVGSVDPEPVLAPGALGAFDDAGVTPSCIVARGAEQWLYYTGWALGVSVPFYLAIGLAVSRDGGAFTRVSAAPILGRTEHDPYLTASPHVLRENGAWRMWYVSGARWSHDGDRPRHHYHLRHGTSIDGVRWLTDGRACVDFAGEHEYAFSRPCVRPVSGGYEMWFSVRGEAYRLGYARSGDGLIWQRDDAHDRLEPSADSWDSEMIAYPCVVDACGARMMLYNGNGYGATGVGVAVLSAS